MIGHILRANEYGGVERIFDAYLKAHSTMEKPHVYGIKKPLSHVLSNILESHGNFGGYIRSIGPLRLPSVIRSYLFNYKLRKDGIDKLLFWNTYESSFIGRDIPVPIIYYDHGLSWHEKENSAFSYFLEGVDRVISCSFASKRVLELYWNLKKPITVIQNPLFPAYISNMCLGKKFPLDRPLRLGMAARLDSAKGHLIAIQAMEVLIKRGCNVHLYFIGKGEDKELIVSKIKKTNLEKYISLSEFTPDLTSFYSMIDVSLQPSIFESWGLSSLEAGSRGCVPIVSCTDGLTEFTVDNETGLVVRPECDISQISELGYDQHVFPKLSYDPVHDKIREPKFVDPKHLASKIEMLIEKPDLFEKISKQASFTFQKEYSFKGYLDELNLNLAQ